MILPMILAVLIVLLVSCLIERGTVGNMVLDVTFDGALTEIFRPRFWRN